jgi:hypothetical protein
VQLTTKAKFGYQLLKNEVLCLISIFGTKIDA